MSKGPSSGFVEFKVPFKECKDSLRNVKIH